MATKVVFKYLVYLGYLFYVIICLKIYFYLYFYLFSSQAMAASSETYEKVFHQQHQEVIEEVMSEGQIPLQSYQMVQIGE